MNRTRICFLSFAFFVVVAIFTASFLRSRSSSTRENVGVRGTDTPTAEKDALTPALPVAERVQCTLFMIDDIPEPGEDPVDHEEWVCLDEGTDTEYSLETLSSDFFEANHVRSGSTILTITSTEKGAIVYSVIVDPQPVYNGTEIISKPTLDLGNTMTKLTLNTAGRTISTTISPSVATSETWERKWEGQLSMLVVRVTDSAGRSPSMTTAKLSDLVFGTSDDPVNLRSQYLACSGGKLEFVPATGYTIVDGVLDVTIEGEVNGVDRSQVQKWTEEILPSYLGGETEKTVSDYTMYVFPSGSDFRGAGAYAATGGRRSVYNNNNVQYLLVQMHEVGHSLEMRHSGYAGSSYDDRSCYLGSHLWDSDAPSMCFNAAKSWFLGWYSEPDKDGHVLVEPKLGNWEGRLTGIDAYLNNENYNDEDYKVVLKIQTDEEESSDYPDLYVMYNRKQGINSEVQGFADKVTIVSQYREAGAQSWVEGSLDASAGSNFFRQSNFDNTGLDLIIQVCYVIEDNPYPDYAKVIVYLDNEKNKLECDDPSPSLSRLNWN